jgi:Domain of Unknown Function (DUF1080)
VKPLRSVFAFLILSVAAAAVPSNRGLCSERQDGWKPLFDGKSLSGWRGYKNVSPGAGWTVQEGSLTTPGGAGDLVTAREYGNFELRLSWKIGRGGNSGIIYRVGLDARTAFETGPEYQLLDNANSSENDGLHSAGAIYDILGPSKDVVKPAGEWNNTLIVVRGWTIEHWLNDEKVVEIDLKGGKGKELIAGSKFRSEPNFATRQRGYIVLQDHGSSVSFRDILIRETD